VKLPSQVQIAKAHQVRFIRYENKNLWYELMWTTENHEYLPFEFPIPVDDAGEGAFLPNMRGIEVLRWARQHVYTIQEGLSESNR
jgi:hypothetical protein